MLAPVRDIKLIFSIYFFVCHQHSGEAWYLLRYACGCAVCRHFCHRKNALSVQSGKKQLLVEQLRALILLFLNISACVLMLIIVLNSVSKAFHHTHTHRIR